MSARHLRNSKPEDEDAAQLKFGPEFSGAEVQEGCLVISEVKILLERRDTQSDNPVYKKTADYVNTFARFHDTDTMQSVREVFAQSTLANFEKAQIANLCPATAEEAKALIPSLSETDDDILQGYLNDVLQLKKHQK